MKLTIDWIKDHLSTNKTEAQIVEQLNNTGLEVESVNKIKNDLSDFLVAKIVKAEKHPNADRLKICVVDTVDGQFKVVCGAPNARVGMLGIFSPVDTYIPGTKFNLTKSKIRGVESCGMLVSEKEMGLSNEHETIIEIGQKFKIS